MDISKSAGLWMSLIIWRISSSEERSVFRNSERVYLKILILKFHRRFNETCIINSLLQILNNIYKHTKRTNGKGVPHLLNFLRNIPWSNFTPAEPKGRDRRSGASQSSGEFWDEFMSVYCMRRKNAAGKAKYIYWNVYYPNYHLKKLWIRI